jgi:hypothetical protein
MPDSATYITVFAPLTPVTSITRDTWRTVVSALMSVQMTAIAIMYGASLMQVINIKAIFPTSGVLR